MWADAPALGLDLARDELVAQTGHRLDHDRVSTPAGVAGEADAGAARAHLPLYHEPDGHCLARPRVGVKPGRIAGSDAVACGLESVGRRGDSEHRLEDARIGATRAVLLGCRGAYDHRGVTEKRLDPRAERPLQLLGPARGLEACGLEREALGNPCAPRQQASQARRLASEARCFARLLRAEIRDCQHRILILHRTPR